MRARNVEIKARLNRAQAALIREEAAALGASEPVDTWQVDTFFVTQEGRLKLREFRTGYAELISYSRADEAGPTLSSYEVHHCDNPVSLRAALDHALGIRGVVSKHRELLVIGQTRVHLDQVEGLGEFLELEVVLEETQDVATGRVIAQTLLATFEIDQDALVEGAYIDLLEALPDP